MRGIIADCVFHGNETSLSIKGGIDPFRLRQYLLYWDKIDYPTNNILRVELTPDEKYLEGIGVLQRTHVNFYTDENGIMISPDIFIRSQLCVLQENNKNGEIWSIGQNNSQLYLPKDETERKSTVQLKLYDCVPVPREDTPFDDILDFKERRRDELIEFRRVMDGMYDAILSSEYPDLKERRCIEELQNKIIDINRVMSESHIKRVLSSVNVELNISDLIQGALNVFAGYNLGEKVGFPEVGAAIGLAASAINITYNTSLKAKEIPYNLKDYAYLFYAKKELL